MTLQTSQISLTKTLTLLTMERVLRRKSTWFFLLIGMLPSLIGLFWVLVQAYPDLAPPNKPFYFFSLIESYYFVTFYVPLLALFLGLGAVSDEIETKNITFTLTRPLSRFSIGIGRVVGHSLAAIFLVSISLTVSYLANMLFQLEDFIGKIDNLFNAMFVLSFGVATYLSIIAFLGSLFKRYATLIGLVWLIFDLVVSLAPFGKLPLFNVRYRMLASLWEMPPQSLPSFSPVVQSSASLNFLACMLMATIACALIGVRLSREIVLTDSNQ